MPSLVKYSIKIISDAGLGMAMFSLGMYYVSIIYDKRNIQTFHTFVSTNLVIITCTLQNSYNFHVGHEIYQNCILIKIVFIIIHNLIHTFLYTIEKATEIMIEFNFLIMSYW